VEQFSISTRRIFTVPRLLSPSPLSARCRSACVLFTGERAPAASADTARFRYLSAFFLVTTLINRCLFTVSHRLLSRRYTSGNFDGIWVLINHGEPLGRIESMLNASFSSCRGSFDASETGKGMNKQTRKQKKKKKEIIEKTVDRFAAFRVEIQLDLIASALFVINRNVYPARRLIISSNVRPDVAGGIRERD